MIKLSSKKFKLALVIFLILILNAGLLAWASLTVPSKFSFVVKTYESNLSGEVRTLPTYQFSRNQASHIEGEIKVPDGSPKSKERINYAYIPNFEGDLIIKADGNIVFRESSPNYLGGHGFALFEVPRHSDGKFALLEFQLKENSKKFVILAEVYFGKYDDFSFAIRNQEIADLLRFSIFGMNLMTILVCVLLIFNRTDVYVSMSSLIIAIFLSLSSLSSLGKMFVIANGFTFSIFFASPLLGANFFLLVKSLSDRRRPPNYWRLQFIATLASIIIVVLGMTVFSGVRSFPITVLVFTVWLPGVLCGLYSIFASWRKSNFENLFFGFALILIMLAISHDLLMRAGYFGHDQYLVPLGRILFSFQCAVILTSLGIEGSKSLKQLNIKLNNELELRTNELNEQFALKQESIALDAVAVERRRRRAELDEELHDGVLSYISLINVMTADSSEHMMLGVNKLSRFASNEIRLIMEASEDQDITLISAISMLRLRYIDRLTELNIRIVYDIVRLSECTEIPYKVIVECMRILQELVHNAAVQARSTKIVIVGEPVFGQDKCGSDRKGFCLSVSNTGGSTFDPFYSSGNGLRNIKNRSDRIGASFRIFPINGGATALVVWPAHFD